MNKWRRPRSIVQHVGLIIAIAFSGCVLMHEPYPGWSVIDVSYDDLPRAVKKAFRRDFGDLQVIKAEQSTFKSRVSGYPKKFRMFFAGPNAASQHVIYNQKGKREDGFEFWFDQMWRTPDESVAASRSR